jgi:hypothetical protein
MPQPRDKARRARDRKPKTTETKPMRIRLTDDRYTSGSTNEECTFLSVADAEERLASVFGEPITLQCWEYEWIADAPTPIAQNAQHTPGPWSIDDDMEREFLLATGEEHKTCRISDSTEQLVALVGTIDGEEDNAEESLKHAHLITAAPELLAALVALSNTADNADSDFAEYRQALRFSVQQARAAIAKALGQ